MTFKNIEEFCEAYASYEVESWHDSGDLQEISLVNTWKYVIEFIKVTKPDMAGNPVFYYVSCFYTDQYLDDLIYDVQALQAAMSEAIENNAKTTWEFANPEEAFKAYCDLQKSIFDFSRP